MISPFMQQGEQPYILVIDDVPANLKLLSDILTPLYNVRPASSGRLALKSLTVATPDLILLDIRMPEMDGYQVCTHLKSHDETKMIPVIFISALDDTADKVKGFHLGAVDFITKPFQSEEVLARVETHLALRKLQKQLETQNIELQSEISKREQIEEELRKYQTHLEELVAERTVDLERSNEELEIHNIILRTQQETSIDGILVIDDLGSILSYNQRFIEIWGIPPGVVESDSHEQMVQAVLDAQTDPEGFRRQMQYLKAHREDKTWEETILKDGRYVEIYSASMIGSGGKYFGRVWYFRDISDRKAAEENLIQSEEKYRSLVDNLNVGVYRNTVGSPCRWQWANHAFVRIFGYDSLEECLEQSVDEAFFKPELCNRISLALGGEGFFKDQEVLLKKKDGTPIWVSITAQVKKSSDGGAVEYVDGMCEDITERRSAQEALRESEARFRVIFEDSAIGIALVDQNGHLLKVNPAIQKMLGYNEEELINMTLPDYSYHEDIQIDHDLFTDLIEGKRDLYTLEKRYVRKDGSLIWGKHLVSLVRDKSGHPLYAVNMVEDITEHKKRQNELKLAIAQINKNMETLAILNDQVRNPLTVISCYTGDIEEEIGRKILFQISIIDKIIDKLDQGWIESEKVRNFLMKHYGIS
ncbi:MAG TPA: PAS domain S-box protein [Methanospirillum sp.]|nr:PAS domain S-box protein [Methanospirillum sp.]